MNNVPSFRHQSIYGIFSNKRKAEDSCIFEKVKVRQPERKKLSQIHDFYLDDVIIISILEFTHGDRPAALAWAASTGYQHIVDILVRANAVNEKGKFGDTALNSALRNGHRDVIFMLIRASVDINMKDAHGDAPLNVALETGHRDIVELLIKTNANVNTKCGCGYTPLIYAASMGYHDTVALLINEGADVNMTDDECQKKAIHWARDNNHFKTMELLRRNGWM